MLDKILAVLRFFRVTDEQGRLSLTNIAMAVTMYCLLHRPEIDIGSMLTFMGSVAGYQFKRWAQPEGSVGEETEALKKSIADLQSAVTAVQIKQGIRKG